MKRFLLFFLMIFYLNSVFSQLNTNLQGIVQIKSAKYELSGFALHPKYGVICVQDEKSDVSAIDSVEWKLTKIAGLEFKNSDLEGIDACQEKIFVLNERKSEVFTLEKQNLMPIFIDYAKFEKENEFLFQREKWFNAGYEGLAVDCSNQILYLIKERTAKDLNDNRYILEIDIKSGSILRKLEIEGLSPNPDFADAKFERGSNGKPFLYLLERNDYMVARLNLQNMDLQRVSFLPYAASPDKKQNLYKTENPQFGIAEALLLTPTQIWIGMDNNQMPVNKNNKWIKQYQLKGKAPLILILDRPQNF